MPAAAQDDNIYFQSPNGSMGVIVSGGPGYVITPFPTSPSYGYPPPPPYAVPSPYSSAPSYEEEYRQGGGPAGCV